MRVDRIHYCGPHGRDDDHNEQHCRQDNGKDPCPDVTTGPHKVDQNIVQNRAEQLEDRDANLHHHKPQGSSQIDYTRNLIDMEWSMCSISATAKILLWQCGHD